MVRNYASVVADFFLEKQAHSHYSKQ